MSASPLKCPAVPSAFRKTSSDGGHAMVRVHGGVNLMNNLRSVRNITNPPVTSSYRLSHTTLNAQRANSIPNSPAQKMDNQRINNQRSRMNHTIHCASQRAARRAAQRKAGMGIHGARHPVHTQRAKPGSQAPETARAYGHITGDRGNRTEVKCKETGRVVHHDPWGHRFGQGSCNITSHYGVEVTEGGKHTTYHFTYGNHDPAENR